MSTLSPRGLALVRASRRAFQPTDADRTRLLAALHLRLGRPGCRPTWDRWCLRSSRAEARWRSRALPVGARAREGREALQGFPYQQYGLPFRWLGFALGTFIRRRRFPESHR
jgi:hypothetical protein